MKDFNKWRDVMLTSKKDDWETPQSLFDQLNAKYHFAGDLAASDENHKVDHYFTREDNSLVQDWKIFGGGQALFLNPPYGRDLNKWVKKAYETSLDYDAPIVLVVPARTDTKYWHEYIFGKAHIDFIRGRLKFEQHGQSTNPAPFPSAIVTYNWKKSEASHE